MALIAGKILTADGLAGEIDSLDGRVTVLEATASNAIGLNFDLSGRDGFTTIDDLGDLAVTVTVPAGRLVKITAHALISKTSDCGFLGTIWSGAVGGSNLGRWAQDSNLDAGDTLYEGSIIIAPTIGSQTYRVRGERTGATGSFDVKNETPLGTASYILVEDIGVDLT